MIYHHIEQVGLIKSCFLPCAATSIFTLYLTAEKTGNNLLKA